MRTCERCGAETVHRSRVRSAWEVLRRAVTHKRPYRCHACQWRGWATDEGSRGRGSHDLHRVNLVSDVEIDALDGIRGQR